MENNTLFDLIGVFIGFAGVMMVLSMLVTTITQQILNKVGARSKSLESALEGLLASAVDVGAKKVDAEVTKLFGKPSEAAGKLFESGLPDLTAEAARLKVELETLLATCTAAVENSTQKCLAIANADTDKALEEAEKAFEAAEDEKSRELPKLADKAQRLEALVFAMKKGVALEIQSAEDDVKTNGKSEEDLSVQKIEIENSYNKPIADAVATMENLEKLPAQVEKNVIQVLKTKARNDVSVVLGSDEESRGKHLPSVTKVPWSKRVPLVNRMEVVEKLPSKIDKKVIKKPCNWIDVEELKGLLTENLDGMYDLDKIDKKFARMEATTKQSFQKHADAWTMGISIVVAIVFQVSSPELITRLSTNEEAREKAVAYSMDQWSSMDEDQLKPVDSDMVTGNALKKFTEKYPKLGKIDGKGLNVPDIVKAIKQAHKAMLAKETESEQGGDENEAVDDDTGPVTDPEGDDELEDVAKVVEEFRSVLEKEKEEAENALNDYRHEKITSLALLDIGIWRGGIDYYFPPEKGYKKLLGSDWKEQDASWFKQPFLLIRDFAIDLWYSDLALRSLVGVLITAWLISLGAPFWYNRLRDAASLRDQLAGAYNKEDKKKEEKPKGDSENQNESA